MFRILTSFKVNECNDAVRVEVRDEPGAGGAHHLYNVEWPTPRGPCKGAPCNTEIRFQNGPIKENGTNGLTHEVLLSIIEDRLKSFQAGPYACRENALALTHLQEAMHWLLHRTRERLQRGVEGTMAK